MIIKDTSGLSMWLVRLVVLTPFASETFTKCASRIGKPSIWKSWTATFTFSSLLSAS